MDISDGDVFLLPMMDRERKDRCVRRPTALEGAMVSGSQHIGFGVSRADGGTGSDFS